MKIDCFSFLYNTINLMLLLDLRFVDHLLRDILNCMESRINLIFFFASFYFTDVYFAK